MAQKLLLERMEPAAVVLPLPSHRPSTGPPAHVARALQPGHRADDPDSLQSADGWFTEEQRLDAQAARYGAARVAMAQANPPRGIGTDVRQALLCARAGAVPWSSLGGGTVYATHDPTRFQTLLDADPGPQGEPVMALAPRRAVEEAHCRLFGPAMANYAETCCPDAASIRSWRVPRRFEVAAVLAALAALAIFWPAGLILGLAALTVLVMLVNMAFKAILAVAVLRRKEGTLPEMAEPAAALRLHKITLLVPLLRESEVAGTLLESLSRLRYPASLVEVIFLLEEDDACTRNTLSRHTMPWSHRVLCVPRGTIQTKPRALNYALPFTTGEIIGVYDAEDRPDPGQLQAVSAAFAAAGPEIACLQGRLNFFNARTNLLSRCFSIEYSAWFGLFLPGLERLGLPIPLGGTTLFLRRDPLEEVGGWDAHNVTEDADLGVRLFRHGYRVALLDSDTLEEANCRAWPWIRQRSRWIKGYIMTYRAHMRRPAALRRDLGVRGFWGFQVLFLGAALSAALTPVHLLFWLAFLNVPVAGLRGPLLQPLGFGFLALEALNIAFWSIALWRTNRRWLIPWLPALHIYFLMSAAAALKACTELLFRPFYWDKTRHGVDA